MGGPLPSLNKPNSEEGAAHTFTAWTQGMLTLSPITTRHVQGYLEHYVSQLTSR